MMPNIKAMLPIGLRMSSAKVSPYSISAKHDLPQVGLVDIKHGRLAQRLAISISLLGCERRRTFPIRLEPVLSQPQLALLKHSVGGVEPLQPSFVQRSHRHKRINGRHVAHALSPPCQHRLGGRVAEQLSRLARNAFSSSFLPNGLSLHYRCYDQAHRQTSHKIRENTSSIG